MSSNGDNINDNHSRRNFQESNKICPFDGVGHPLYKVAGSTNVSDIRTRQGGPPTSIEKGDTYICFTCGFKAFFIPAPVIAKYQSWIAAAANTTTTTTNSNTSTGRNE